MASFFDRLKSAVGLKSEESIELTKTDENSPYSPLLSTETLQYYEVTFTEDKLGLGIVADAENLPIVESIAVNSVAEKMNVISVGDIIDGLNENDILSFEIFNEFVSVVGRPITLR